MNLGLCGKTAVITGGGSGIGKATALAFAREGCKVAICGRTAKKLEAVREELEALGCEAYAEAVDVTDIPALRAFAKNVYEKFGRLDIWFNNAGSSYAQRISEVTEQDWENQVGVNMKAVFFGSQVAAQYMIEGKQGGVIINTSSYGAIIPTPPRTLYAASKTAILSFTKTFAAEYAPHGIRVVSVLPGMIETELSKKVREASGGASWAADVAAGRLGNTDEIAEPVVFLASDKASYISGVGVEISGGKYCVQKPADSWK